LAASYASTPDRGDPESFVTAQKILFQFPGQGSQYRGMGSDLVAEFPIAAGVYEQASKVLGYDIAKLSFEDPENELDKTRFTQPALLTHQVACLAAFRGLTGDTIKPVLAAGHSLGEYTALVAAGGLSLETALRLVAERGRLMSELGRGSMLATTLDAESARNLADKHYCGVAGCNLPDQTVVAGEKRDLAAFAADLKQSHGGKRVIELNTEGAFHTYLMVAAAQEFRPVLENAELGPLGFDVLSNYTGAAHVDDAGAIRARLFFQLFNPVRWVDCMSYAVSAGIDLIIEFGGGIGKGEGPADKRPNLESVARKSLKWHGHEAQYCAAINAAGIRSAAEQMINQ
jgi:[acyl-carrier-protein] S-malonyltransferase